MPEPANLRPLVFEGKQVQFEGRNLVFSRPKSKWGRLLVKLGDAMMDVLGSKNVSYNDITPEIDMESPFAVFRLESLGGQTADRGLTMLTCEVDYFSNSADDRMLFAEKLGEHRKVRVLNATDGVVRIGEGIVPVMTLTVQVSA